VTKSTAFWDASALVPICVREAATSQVNAHLRKFEPVVWWASAVEVYSAITRLHRNGLISGREKAGAVLRLQILQQGWREVLPDDALRELALRLLDMYPLRAADSLQLAAALTWCRQKPSARTFICGDKRLAVAARASGFTVLELSLVT
jgi:predicted nucleic acid-binding protein